MSGSSDSRGGSSRLAMRLLGWAGQGATPRTCRPVGARRYCLSAATVVAGVTSTCAALVARALGPSIQLETNDAMIAQGPLLRYAQQQTEVAQAQWKLDRSQWVPSLQAGGFYQTLDHAQPFWGYQVGLGIPLPGSGQGARTKASRLGTEIAMHQLESTQRTVMSAFTQASTQAQQLDQLVAYYETKGEALATSLLTSAHQGYTSGDIDHFAYIQGVDQAYRIRTEHLTALLDRANATLQLRALLGQ